MDYVSLQLICYRLGLALPIVVAGDNLNFPVVGPFLQHAGMFESTKDVMLSTDLRKAQCGFVAVLVMMLYTQRSSRRTWTRCYKKATTSSASLVCIISWCLLLIADTIIEGGRSRTGKLLQPKFGILSFLLESVLSGQVEDAIICPVSTQYDKVIEVE